MYILLYIYLKTYRTKLEIWLTSGETVRKIHPTFNTPNIKISKLNLQNFEPSNMSSKGEINPNICLI